MLFTITRPGLSWGQLPGFARIPSEYTDNIDSAEIVGFSNRLLHHLIMKYEKLINMQKKLQPIQGGVYRYLTCLAKLAFKEDDLVYGAIIDPEVALCARDMLEALLTPEEGDAIYEAFSGPWLQFGVGRGMHVTGVCETF